jgi:hypothetical protein
VGTSQKTNQAKLAAFDPGEKFLKDIPDRQTQCHAPIEEKIERDRSSLRAVGFDYDDFVGHLLEVFTVLTEGDKARSEITEKPEDKISATRLCGPKTNVLKLKLIIE